ncbi:MAG: hypothetical protein V2A73_14730 [Pseudomonadota bacterium]
MRIHLEKIVTAVAAGCLAVSVALPRDAAATTTPSNVPEYLRDYAATDDSRDLLVRVDEVLNALTYTYYSSLDYWDPVRGVYKVVCAGYLNHLFDEALASQYDWILDYYDKTKLGVWDYYSFFRSIPVGGTKGGWIRLGSFASIRPGDVLVWRKNDAESSSAWGHAVVVVGMPVRDYRWPNAYSIRVSDSTSTPHSDDNRCSSCSGVGAGVMLFKVNPDTGRPYALAWTSKGYWNSEVSIVMARP